MHHDIIRANPEGVPPPVGVYSHVAIVPGGSELIVCAGQIGNAADGSCPSDALAQTANALRNVSGLLHGLGLTHRNVIKINIWMTERVDRDGWRALWHEFHKGEPPPTTLALVAGLARPEFKVEIECWAARPPTVPVTE